MLGGEWVDLEDFGTWYTGTTSAGAFHAIRVRGGGLITAGLHGGRLGHQAASRRAARGFTSHRRFGQLHVPGADFEDGIQRAWVALENGWDRQSRGPPSAGLRGRDKRQPKTRGGPHRGRHGQGARQRRSWFIQRTRFSPRLGRVVLTRTSWTSLMRWRAPVPRSPPRRVMARLWRCSPCSPRPRRCRLGGDRSVSGGTTKTLPLSTAGWSMFGAS